MSTDVSPIPASEAIRIAREAFADLFTDETIREVRVEEIGISDDGSEWSVTIGFNLLTDLGTVVKGPLHQLFASDLLRDRQYKRVILSAADGQLKRIEIRQL